MTTGQLSQQTSVTPHAVIRTAKSDFHGGSVDAGRTSDTGDQRHHWTTQASHLAIVWCLAYGAMGVFWSLGGPGFPFGAENDPDPAIEKGLSIVGWVSEEYGAPVVAVFSLVGAVVAYSMASGWGSKRTGFALIAFAWTSALLLAVVIPDSRPMIAAGHIPILLAGKPFGWPDGVSISSQVPWPVINQGILIVGGFLFALTAVGYQRRRRKACLTCGRKVDAQGTISNWSIARIGVWATWTAAALPAVYAITRWAYALGIPLGVSSEFLAEMERENPGIWLGGALLGLLAVSGSFLTLGLIQKWGEVFPRWFPVVRGKRVPVLLAVVPAMIVAAIATSAGLMLVRIQLMDRDFGSWSLTGPGLLWPIWGFALAIAALAYYYRRRGLCRVCGQG